MSQVFLLFQFIFLSFLCMCFPLQSSADRIHHDVIDVIEELPVSSLGGMRRDEYSALRGVVFDGGGIRGAYSISVFNEICETALKETPPHRCFTHFGGTSTGSLIAIALTVPKHRRLENGRPIGRWDDGTNWLDGPYSPKEVKQLYRYLSSRIFVSNDLCGDDRGCCGVMGTVIRAITSIFTCCGKCCKCWAVKNCGGLCGPKYTNRNLCYFLQEYFGDFKIKDLLGDITIVAIDVNGRAPVFFNKDSYPEIFVRDAALASTAAQTFFPPVTIQTRPGVEDDNLLHCVDGGVVDNSPVTPVMIRMLRNHREPNDFFLLSIGTGELPRSDRIASLRSAGLLKWAAEVPSQGISASTHAATTHMEELSSLIGLDLLSEKRRFFRIQPHLNPEDSVMDDSERAPLLIELGEAIARTRDPINQTFRDVVDRIRISLHVPAPYRRQAWVEPPHAQE